MTTRTIDCTECDSPILFFNKSEPFNCVICNTEHPPQEGRIVRPGDPLHSATKRTVPPALVTNSVQVDELYPDLKQALQYCRLTAVDMANSTDKASMEKAVKIASDVTQQMNTHGGESNVVVHLAGLVICDTLLSGFLKSLQDFEAQQGDAAFEAQDKRNEWGYQG